jgi:hypothetical protein
MEISNIKQYGAYIVGGRQQVNEDNMVRGNSMRV